jgi:hypothetical protein
MTHFYDLDAPALAAVAKQEISSWQDTELAILTCRSNPPGTRNETLDRALQLARLQSLRQVEDMLGRYRRKLEEQAEQVTATAQEQRDQDAAAQQDDDDLQDAAGRLADALIERKAIPAGDYPHHPVGPQADS